MIMKFFSNSVDAQNETNQRLQYVDVCLLFWFHFQIFREADKRFLRQLWDVYKKVEGYFFH